MSRYLPLPPVVLVVMLVGCADKAPGQDCLIEPCPTGGNDVRVFDAGSDSRRDLTRSDPATSPDVDEGDLPLQLDDMTDEETGGMAPDAGDDSGGDALSEPDVDFDFDDDGVPDALDDFPEDPLEWSDSDHDGVGDNADACPFDEAGWIDSDTDEVCDESDAFPDNPSEWADTDDDGVGDNTDDDDDGDNILDEEELVYGSDCAVSDPLAADTDNDGVDDIQDPYPRDPFPEFLLRRNDLGSIDLYLSNRDGTFQAPVAIGEPIEHEGTPLTYDVLSIGDFNGDGEMDFTAHSSVIDGGTTRKFYFFWRDTKADEFVQELIGNTDRIVAGIVTDATADFNFDIVRFEVQRDGNVAGGHVAVFLNNWSGGMAPSCVYGNSAADGCFFVHLPDISVTSTVQGQWIARMAGQAVNLDPDTDSYPDLTLVTYASGGNAATSVYTMFGTESGGFEAPVSRFVHNESRTQAPANTVLFADFDNDDVGDIVLGFDDDGRAGEAWTYFGAGDGGFEETTVMSVDLNPTNARESGGGETLGRTGSGKTFDFDFDGNYDLIVGYNHVSYTSAGETRLYLGNGDGTFGPSYSVIGPASTFAHAFAIPQRLCPTFEVGEAEAVVE